MKIMDNSATTTTTAAVVTTISSIIYTNLVAFSNGDEMVEPSGGQFGVMAALTSNQSVNEFSDSTESTLDFVLSSLIAAASSHTTPTPNFFVDTNATTTSMAETSTTATSATAKFNQLKIIKLSLLVVLFVLIFCGNSFVLVALNNRKLKINRMYFFLVHLSIADLITAFFNVIPQFVWTITVKFYGGNFLCKSIKFLQMLGPYLSSYVLVMTSIDRYQAICHPLSNSFASNSTSRSRWMIATAWSIALLFCAPQLVFFSYIKKNNTPNDDDELDSDEQYDCWAAYRNDWLAPLYVTWYAVSSFFIPFCILTYTHVIICHEIWLNWHSKRQSLMHKHPRNIGNSAPNAAHHPNLNHRLNHPNHSPHQNQNLHHGGGSATISSVTSVSVTTINENRRLLGKRSTYQCETTAPPSSSSNSSPALKGGSTVPNNSATATPSAYCRLFCWYHKSSASSASSTTSLTRINSTKITVPASNAPNAKPAIPPTSITLNQANFATCNPASQQPGPTSLINISNFSQNNQIIVPTTTDTTKLDLNDSGATTIINCSNCQRMRTLFQTIHKRSGSIESKKYSNKNILKNNPSSNSNRKKNCKEIVDNLSCSNWNNNNDDNKDSIKTQLKPIESNLSNSSTSSSSSTSQSNSNSNNNYDGSKVAPSVNTSYIHQTTSSVCVCHKISLIFNKLNQELYSSRKTAPGDTPPLFRKQGSLISGTPLLKHAKSESEICFDRQRRRTRKRRLRENSVRTPSTGTSSDDDEEDQNEDDAKVEPHLHHHSSLSLTSSSSTKTFMSSSSSSSSSQLLSKPELSKLPPTLTPTLTSPMSSSSLGSVSSSNSTTLPPSTPIAPPSSSPSTYKHKCANNVNISKKSSNAAPVPSRGVRPRHPLAIKRHYSLGKLTEPFEPDMNGCDNLSVTNSNGTRQLGLVPIEQIYRWIQSAKVAQLTAGPETSSVNNAAVKSCQHQLLTQSLSNGSNWSNMTGNSAATTVAGMQNSLLHTAHRPLNQNEPICHCCYYTAITSPVAVLCPDCGEYLPTSKIKRKISQENSNNGAARGVTPGATLLQTSCSLMECHQNSSHYYHQRNHDRHPHIIKPLRSKSTILVNGVNSKNLPPVSSSGAKRNHSSCTSLAVNPLNVEEGGGVHQCRSSQLSQLQTVVPGQLSCIVSTSAISAAAPATTTTTMLTTATVLPSSYHLPQNHHQTELNSTKSSLHYSSPTTTPTGTKKFVPRNYHINHRGTNKRLSNPRIHSMQGLTRAKIKTVKITLIVITCYVLCSSPFILVQLWANWWPGAAQTAFFKSPLIAILMLLPSLNSCVNPWIYIYFNPNLISSFCSLFTRRSSNNLMNNNNNSNTATCNTATTYHYNNTAHNSTANNSNVFHKNSKECQAAIIRPGAGGGSGQHLNPPLSPTPTPYHRPLQQTLTGDSQKTLELPDNHNGQFNADQTNNGPSLDQTEHAVGEETKLLTIDQNGCHRTIISSS